MLDKQPSCYIMLIQTAPGGKHYGCLGNMYFITQSNHHSFSEIKNLKAIVFCTIIITIKKILKTQKVSKRFQILPLYNRNVYSCSTRVSFVAHTLWIRSGQERVKIQRVSFVRESRQIHRPRAENPDRSSSTGLFMRGVGLSRTKIFNTHSNVPNKFVSKFSDRKYKKKKPKEDKIGAISFPLFTTRISGDDFFVHSKPFYSLQILSMFNPSKL